MSALGSDENPLKIAVVGSGPSGFYAAEALIKSGKAVAVDMIERLPAPFGLVRNGVAPDHPKLKQAILVYQKIAESPAFSFCGNVTVGRDVTVDELRGLYHAVIFTCGDCIDMDAAAEHLRQGFKAGTIQKMLLSRGMLDVARRRAAAAALMRRLKKGASICASVSNDQIRTRIWDRGE